MPPCSCKCIATFLVNQHCTGILIPVYHHTCARGLLTRIPSVAAVAAPVAALLATILLVWLYTRSRSSGRTLLGAVAPPGVGSSTTLLVTDIQVR
jgi:hypothetical protein